MGRWINKIRAQSTPAKPAEPSFAGFAGSDHRGILEKFIHESCLEISIDPKLIINRLLSIRDTQDIIKGRIQTKELSFIIKLWVADGMPYMSDKMNKGE